MTRFNRLIFICFSGAVLQLIKPQLVEAEILISEVAANPISGPEWVELINTSEQTFDLSGYYLEDVLTTPSTIFTFNTNELLSGQQVKVFNLPTTKLNNSGDGVTLKNSAGVVVDHVNFGNSDPGETWQRLVPTSSSLTLGQPSPNMVNWSSEPTVDPILTPSPPLPTPTAIQSINLTATPSPSVASASATPMPTLSPVYIPANTIKLSEVVACADSHGEWVEVNNYSSQNIDLSDWAVIDSSGNKRSFNTTVVGLGLTTLAWQENMLNNSGDSIVLTNARGDIQDSLNLPACQTGDSYAQVDQVWRITHQSTYNAVNIIISTNEAPTLTLIPTSHLMSNPTAVFTPIISKSTHITSISQARFSLPMGYLDQLQISHVATPTGSLKSQHIDLSQSNQKQLPGPQQNHFFLWSGIMGSLLLLVGGLLLTHVSLPFAIPIVGFPIR